MKRYRISMRQMMLVVAIVAGLATVTRGLKERSIAFTARADHFVAVMGEWRQERACELATMDREEAEKFLAWQAYRWDFARAMERKYRRSGHYPFLPVASDPPEPKGGTELSPLTQYLEGLKNASSQDK